MSTAVRPARIEFACFSAGPSVSSVQPRILESFLESLRLLKWVLLMLALVLLFGTLGYSYLENVPPFEAFYMTVITITTVGFGETIQLHEGGRLFTVFLIFLGAGMIMLTVGVLTQVAVEGTYLRGREKKRVLSKIKKLEGHYVVCGAGRIGKYVIGELKKRDVPLVVLEADEQVAEELTADNQLCICGSATDEEVLERANLENAKGLVVTVSTDAEAVFIILTARDLNPDLFIVARAIEEHNESKIRRAGANRVMSPYRLIGRRMANSMLHPAVIDMLDNVMFSDELDLALEGLKVYSGSAVAGQTLRESSIRDKFGLVVIGVQKAHGNLVFNPKADEVIEAGDTLISIGEKDALMRLAEYLSGR
jgi:voltage-gated potassium channel